MSIVSIEYLFFIAVLFIAYWNISAKFQWILLLAASIIFYVFNAPMYTLIYIGISVIIVYMATVSFDRDYKYKKMVLVLTLVLILGTLAVLKYTNMFAGTLYLILGLHYTSVHWVAPLAISYYTLQLVAYTLDCYWGIEKAEKNIFKVLLYTIYFPQMVSGPISRYSNLGKVLFEEHRFDYDRVVTGLKRIAWGIIKKLFVASRLKILADTVFNDPLSFSGVWIWLGMALFVLELYADFSGCMDIVIGVSNCFGIELCENFNAPLLSRAVQEFWQRWHITLGGFLRDYLMNPLLKSAKLLRMGEFFKKKLGKKQGKKIPVYLAMLIVWIAMGIWHGSGWKFIIGEGLWFWLVIVLEQTLSPLSAKIKNNKLYLAFCVMRTFALVCIGNLFFRADSLKLSIQMLKLAFAKTNDWWVIGIFQMHGIGKDAMGGIVKLILFLFFMSLMLLFEIMEYKGKSPYKYLSRQNVVIRWGIYWLFAIVIAYNIFGEQADFIYAGF